MFLKALLLSFLKFTCKEIKIPFELASSRLAAISRAFKLLREAGDPVLDNPTLSRKISGNIHYQKKE